MIWSADSKCLPGYILIKCIGTEFTEFHNLQFDLSKEAESQNTTFGNLLLLKPITQN